MERYSDTSVVAPERNSKAFKRCCSRLSLSTCIRVNGRSRPHWDQRFSSLCSFQVHVVCACRILNLNKQKHQTTLVFTMFFGVNATSVLNSGFRALCKKHSDVCTFLSNMHEHAQNISYSCVFFHPITSRLHS